MLDLEPLSPDREHILQSPETLAGPSFTGCLFLAHQFPEFPFAWVFLVHCCNPDRRSILFGEQKKNYYHDGAPQPSAPSQRFFIKTDSLLRTSRVCLVFLRRLFDCRLL